LKRNLYTLFIFISSLLCYSQTLSVQFFKADQECNKGSAGIQILSGKQPVTINWSTGVTNNSSISDLNAGDYSVTVKDSAQKDTVINFKIEKLECKVIIANHFTPNGDNYNDTWSINQTTFYPEFELYVFNKWGQQVHSQKGTYTPWDGGNHADGTYYYVFYYKGSDKNKFQKGDVTILR
jgi:gliding motility-associated-like protein